MSIPLPPINVSQYGKDTTADEIVRGVRMEDKVVIITGCTSGLGKETARAMAKTGAHVIITGRDMDKADAVVAELIASTGNERIESHWLDLSSFATVRESAEIFLARGLPLHYLILNAGVMACPYMKTVDGFELQFATNHLGHFLFTNLLIPVMRKSQPARVIVLSSAGHKRAGINWDDINFDLGYDKWIAYAQSKTANILFAKELARRYQATGVSAFAVHPGGIMTELSRHLSQDEIRAFGWIDAEGKINSRFKSAQQGAATVVWAATTRDLKDRGGEYLEDCNISGNMEGMDPAQQRSIGYAGVAAHAQSMDDAIRLWELSEQWTGCPSAFSSRTTALEVVAGLDLTGRVAMITGAASGIGVETARALAQAGAHVIIAARDTDKAEAVVKSIKEATGNDKVEWMYLDLASFSMIREFVIHFESKDLPLHILINNAGIMATPQTHSDDGLEMQFATNHLGHFLLTNLLIPKLQASAPARVVVVTSVANRRGKIQWEDIHYNHTPYNKWHAYAQSKLANVLFMRELQRRYASVGISALAVHPGGIMTELQRSVAHEEQIAMGWIDGEGRQHPLFKSPQQGAATSTYAACHPDLEGLGGLYLEDCGISIGLTDIKWCGYGEQSLKMDDAARLWRVSERMCGMITGNDTTPSIVPGRTFTTKSTGEEVIRDIHLRGKVAIVTGAASGLGLETARCLAIAGAHVFVTGRNLHKLQMVVNDIIASTGNEQVEPLLLDLSSFANVREGVATFLAKKLPLHLLICNAATMANPHEKTVDGHEIQFAINHLAHFLLVNLLLSTLQSSGGARVVIVASQAHKRSGIRWDDIHGDLKYDKYLYYAQSKTANILFMRELNRRYGASGITTHAVHPGGILTQLQRRMTREEMIKLGWMDGNGKAHANFKSVEQGAATIVYAATAPELSGQSGEYLENCAITTHSTHPYSGVAEHALNTAEATKLWEYSERVTGAGSVEWY